MYDTFEPFEEYKPNDFYFKSSFYKVWNDGDLILENEEKTTIISAVKPITNRSLIIVQLDNSIGGRIKLKMSFDKLVSSNDRMIMLNLPEQNDHQKIQMLLNFYNETRPKYTFDYNEAYICNMFFKNGFISKLSFNIYGDETLIEFYK